MNLDTPTNTPDKLVFAPETYQYTLSTLMETEILDDPIKQFNSWFDEACKSNEPIPESVVLSTSNKETGRVSSRVVLLKELDSRGWLIFSNFDTSKKNKDLQTNSFASLTFLWKSSQRQVRVEGLVERLSWDESQEYFSVRPRGSKIGAWASPQSTVISNRDELEELVKSKEIEYKDVSDDKVLCPPGWGGIRIVPLEVEFWQGRESRLHDRLSFRRDEIDKPFKIVRLAP